MDIRVKFGKVKGKKAEELDEMIAAEGFEKVTTTGSGDEVESLYRIQRRYEGSIPSLRAAVAEMGGEIVEVA